MLLAKPVLGTWTAGQGDHASQVIGYAADIKFGIHSHVLRECYKNGLHLLS